ncbi:MAG: hypothetical protein GY847_36175 [Proteobacteria bacterium]|nr:hypothetical protein [Pseudomonadota bacterium]
MSNPRHRPRRSYADAKRMIIECELEKCTQCGEQLVPSGTWHARKTVQTMKGPLFVAGKSKKCNSVDCKQYGHHYHASGVLQISLPHSTYGLDILAFIGWQHEHEHKQFVEIQKMLNQREIEVCERQVGRLYRRFLALLGGKNKKIERKLEETAKKHGGLMWGVDALQPEGHGTLLYVLYEVLSGTAVSGVQLDHPTADELVEWLKPYSKLPYKALATLSDGENTIIAALETCWPDAPRQRCTCPGLPSTGSGTQFGKYGRTCAQGGCQVAQMGAKRFERSASSPY